MPEEPTADLDDVAAHVRRELDAFRARHGRSLHLEIEPGTYLVAQAGAVVATCIDVVDTGKDGYLFAKLDTGMTEVTRPSLYGAQHPIDVMATGREAAEVVFVGPCCESGDILTPAPGDPAGLGPRWVSRPRVGRPVSVGGAGANPSSCWSTAVRWTRGSLRARFVISASSPRSVGASSPSEGRATERGAKRPRSPGRLHPRRIRAGDRPHPASPHSRHPLRRVALTLSPSPARRRAAPAP